MFYYISGTLAMTGENLAVVDAGGVGYKIYTSAIALDSLGEIGSSVKMYTYTYIREEAFDLYGFGTPEDMDMFSMLISVSGIGPKAALAILSIMTCNQIAAAIMSGDEKAISRAHGVGPKVAAKAILELKSKIDKNAGLYMGADQSAPAVRTGSAANEAVEALMVLGYSANEAKNALGGVDLTQDLELIIKQTLKKMMK